MPEEKKEEVKEGKKMVETPSVPDNIDEIKDKKVLEAGSETKKEPKNEEIKPTPEFDIDKISIDELLEISMPPEEERIKRLYNTLAKANFFLWLYNKIKDTKSLFVKDIHNKFSYSIQYISTLMSDYVSWGLLKKVKVEGIVHYEFALNGKLPIMEKYVKDAKETVARILQYQKSERFAKLSDNK